MNSNVVTCLKCGRKNRVPAEKQHLGPKCGNCGNPIDMRRFAVPVELDDSTLGPFIGRASLPVLVDFFSPTCGPCRSMSPIIDSLAKKFLGRIIIAKLDTSRNHEAPARYRIRGVPTLIVFENGEVADQMVGAMPEADLARKLDQMA